MAAWEGDPLEQLARQVLLPALAWRAGAANAAAREAAVEALGGLLQRRLLPAEHAARLVETARALPLLRQVREAPRLSGRRTRCFRGDQNVHCFGSKHEGFLLYLPLQCLEDDYREGTRLGACIALERLLTTGAQTSASLTLEQRVDHKPATPATSSKKNAPCPWPPQWATGCLMARRSSAWKRWPSAWMTAPMQCASLRARRRRRRRWSPAPRPALPPAAAWLP